MTRLTTLTLTLALTAQAAAAGPAERAPSRPMPRPTAVQAALEQFADQDRVQRPQPVTAQDSFVFSSHGPNRPR